MRRSIALLAGVAALVWLLPASAQSTAGARYIRAQTKGKGGPAKKAKGPKLPGGTKVPPIPNPGTKPPPPPKIPKYSGY